MASHCVELMTYSPEVGFGVTLPLMVSTTVAFSALLVTVIVFVKLPGRPEVLYPTLIEAVAPGIIGSFFHSGVVHPHEAIAFEITTGAFPVFFTSKEYVAIGPSFSVPKS